MEPWTLITDFILIAGISLLGLNILFLIKSGKRFSQKILILFFLNALFFLLYYYSYLHRLKLPGAIAVFFGNGTGFLLGPLLLFQLRSLVLPKKQFIKSFYLHLMPFAVIWLFVSVPLSISMATAVFDDFGAWYAEHDYYFNLTENVFFITYVIISLKLLKRIEDVAKEHSSTDKNNLSWYRHLLIGFAIIILLDTLCTVYELFYPVLPWNIGTIIAFSLVLLYSYLGYKGMFQSQILLPDFLLQKLVDDNPKTEDKNIPPQKNTVRHLDNYTSQDIENLKIKLYKALNEKKLYRYETLSLTDLAEEMDVSTKKISELLNQYLHTTFYNLINQYRVNEVIERMALPDAGKYTLMGIAYDCGFQSKASFNRIFKQKTGKSPSDFRKDQIADTELPG